MGRYPLARRWRRGYRLRRGHGSERSWRVRRGWPRPQSRRSLRRRPLLPRRRRRDEAHRPLGLPAAPHPTLLRRLRRLRRPHLLRLPLLPEPVRRDGPRRRLRWRQRVHLLRLPLLPDRLRGWMPVEIHGAATPQPTTLNAVGAEGGQRPRVVMEWSALRA